MVKVCYLTSKASTDIRVFEKECISLSNAGFDVYLISANSKDEIKRGIKIFGVPYPKKGLINRLFVLPNLLYKKALKINADIYHFNDPATLYYGLKLKKMGKKVIFDSFEDHPTLIFEKKSIPYILRLIISKLYSYYEYQICKHFDGLILCYHWTQERLNKACSNNKLIFNFPIINTKYNNPNTENNTICYAGLISHIWNIENILSSISSIDNVAFNLAGNIGDNVYFNKLEKNNGWQKVIFFGKIGHNEVYEMIYSQSSIGMALLDYIPLCKGDKGNLSNNKLFEYMMSGIPVICTNFSLWKEVVEQYNCGICVNPRNVHEITDAIIFLLSNKEIARKMGENGQTIVQNKYNWNEEEKKLIELYNSIL